jgi:serine/threonine protein phosphatase PrpC
MQAQATTNQLLEIAAESIAGTRPDNQDRVSHFGSPFGYVFVVADGMGGHSGGGLASFLVVSRLPEILRAIPPGEPPQQALTNAIQSVNRLILNEAGAGIGGAVEGMGTTVAAVLVRDTPDGSLAIGAHVGDSRIYFLRGAQLFCLTRDHTIVEKLVESGALTAEQALDHPQAGVLTRALGRLPALPVDLTSWHLLKPGDIFLLCSDGLSGYASGEAIRQTLASGDAPEVLARRLVELAIREGSQDNISVLVFRVAASPALGNGA